MITTYLDYLPGEGANSKSEMRGIYTLDDPTTPIFTIRRTTNARWIACIELLCGNILFDKVEIDITKHRNLYRTYLDKINSMLNPYGFYLSWMWA